MKKLSEQIANEIAAKLITPEFKSFIELTTKAADSDVGTFEVVITTENVDRMGEVIKVDGWDLEHYMKNPVVLWGHSHYDLPIGVCTSIEKIEGKLIAKGKFAPEDANPMGQYCRRLYDLGILRATSVGFIEKEREGNLITKAELLEFSFVSVPANPMALSTLIKGGFSLDELVTKGILNVKEAEPVDDPVPPVDPEPTDEELKEEEEKAFKKLVVDTLNELKTLVLEVSRKAEPEHKDEVPGDESPEVKAFRLFSEGRKYMQLASTALAESLAEARKAVDLKIQ